MAGVAGNSDPDHFVKTVNVLCSWNQMLAEARKEENWYG